MNILRSLQEYRQTQFDSGHNLKGFVLWLRGYCPECGVDASDGEPCMCFSEMYPDA